MVKSPFERWTADQLLRHEFILGVSGNDGIITEVDSSLDSWVTLHQPSAERTRQDVQDLRVLVDKTAMVRFISVTIN